MYGGELPCARNCAGGFLFFAQVNLHFLNLGTHLEEFLIKWSRLRGDGLHMVSVVVPYNLGSFSDLKILVPPLEMGFDIFGGLVSHWFVAPFTAGGVEQNRLVDNVISETEKLGSQWGIAHLRCDFVTKKCFSNRSSIEVDGFHVLAVLFLLLLILAWVILP